ncbi:isoprenylcysteine carboxylmethyltransferase family protein [Frigidibacter albus]|uniref:Isoprenylcysteine carboxylmethyltransferase family protein n=1 Tax=Frigidibacter albus TaxID=1465486 RepID=A0A6L8VD81_9RHOB|nr:isoprenylcysteine carboxylmethyltransferase family protein [Frigidibacter albus]MZQ88257.1 isoprenylcysteine carboxylmethyltransferase family protein [Frigidibacter albus]NBE30069.1 isoprenylcysteine carboxylmethyltransferase family protein [Frigidibacter albus]GGH46503.1 S-isoprenylcysteine methyltransferase [Frigidibacter albus]
MNALKALDYPPIWLAGFAVLAWALGAVPLRLFGPSGGTVGAGLIGAGLLLMLAAAAQMLLARTTIIPHREPGALVTGGVFRLSRNPIYLADALVLAGVIVLRDAPLAVPLLPLFMAVIQKRFIFGEEARLRAAFGPDFADYAARTRRWL